MRCQLPVVAAAKSLTAVSLVLLQTSEMVVLILGLARRQSTEKCEQIFESAMCKMTPSPLQIILPRLLCTVSCI